MQLCLSRVEGLQGVQQVVVRGVALGDVSCTRSIYNIESLLYWPKIIKYFIMAMTTGDIACKVYNEKRFRIRHNMPMQFKRLIFHFSLAFYFGLDIFTYTCVQKFLTDSILYLHTEIYV